jgi:hypothetical protein
VLLIVDGCEKAGKTTFLKALEVAGTKGKVEVEYVHWGPIPKTLPNGDPGDTRYLAKLQEDVAKRHLVVWDRSWASEFAYAPVPGQDDHRLCDDHWLGEWLYGRAADERLILLGPDVETLTRKRDNTDLPINPYIERERYRRYGLTYGWRVLENQHDDETLRHLVNWVLDLYEKRHDDVRLGPPAYCGPEDAKIVFLGERRNDGTGPQKGYGPPGAWLPFTSRYTEKLGRSLGSLAMKVGWTNVYDVLESPAEANPLVNAEMIVACGQVAHRYAGTLPGKFILEIPHPSAMYRWGAMAEQVEDVERRVRASVLRFFADKSPVVETDRA